MLFRSSLKNVNKNLQLLPLYTIVENNKEIQIFISTVGITVETCVKKKSTVTKTVEIGVKNKK